MIADLQNMLYGADENAAPLTVDNLLTFARVTRTLVRGKWSARIDLGNLVAVVGFEELGEWGPFESDREILRYAAENGRFS